MSYGVTASGFVKKTLTVIKGEIEDTLRDTISSTLNLLATSTFGQIIGILADKDREMWDVAQAIYRAFDPDYAEDDALDNVCSITGTYREAAEESTVTLDQIWLDATTTLPLGSICSVGADGAQFTTTAAVTNASAVAATVSVLAESVDTGEIQGLAQSIDTIQTPVSGWSDQAALTCVNAETYTLNGLTLIIEVDEGAAQTTTFATANPLTAANVASEVNSQTTGITASDVSGQVRIESDTGGSGSAIQVTGGTGNAALGFATALVKGFNSSDATLGSAIETNEELRIRREARLQAAGSGTPEAIRVDIEDLSFVTSATVFPNNTDVTDVDGVPPHAVEVVVVGGTETDVWVALTVYVATDLVANGGNIYICVSGGTSAASGGPTGTGAGVVDGTCVWDYSEPDDEWELAEALWNTVGAGIGTHGSLSRTIQDSQGNDQVISYSRPTEVPIYLWTWLTIDSDTYPSDGDDQVKAALVAKMLATQSVGDDVIALVYRAEQMTVAGVLDVPTQLIHDSFPPVDANNVVIGAREIATLDSSDIQVNS